MTVRSAGLLLYKLTDAGELHLWIAHMGGPFWARKDEHAWSIPKGEYDLGENPMAVALREFEEEMGEPAPRAAYTELGDFRQPSGKIVTVFTAEVDFAPESIRSNTFPLEWPRGSGRVREFPEVDDARWIPVQIARTKLVRGQAAIIDSLIDLLRASGRQVRDESTE